MRHFNLKDQLIEGFDTLLRCIVVPAHRATSRQNPADASEDTVLSATQKKHIAGLMRVNHTGEVCAQALYQGQALTARDEDIKVQMQQAAAEEIDHLAWCEQRLTELDAKPSFFNGFWYIGSYLLGAMAGLAGDGWSLAFVAETEHQVSAHLQHHLNQLPSDDHKTKALLVQMEADEMAHAEQAIRAGATTLPFLIRQCMQGMSKLMTSTSYHI